MKECVQRTRMPPNSWYFHQIREDNSRIGKVVNSEIHLGVPFMVPNLVHKYKLFIIRGT
jgi:hypothetical protein